MEYRGLPLDGFQEAAIRHLENEHSVLVAAPTGTGKTLIADWIVDRAMREGKRVIYTAPIKALSNQKFRDYGRLHGEDNVGLVTGDLVIRRNAPCLVMTTEILRNMLLSGEPLDDLLAVVIDEIHFLDDPERGTVWEEVLIYLPQHVLIVALSATLPNLQPFAAWLSHVRQRPVQVVTETRRAVPLDWWFCNQARGLSDPEDFDRWATSEARKVTNDRGARGRGRGRNDREERDRLPRTHPGDVVKAIRQKGWLPMLYFVFSRKDAERFAFQLHQRLRGDLTTVEQERELDRRLREAAPAIGNALDPQLRDLYRRGIAFHHAGLHVQLKALVEELYEAKLISVLFCTSTFALGINMPARTVAFHGIEKFDGTEVRPLTTRGFMQKAGRAGRRGLDEAGHVVLRMDPHEWAVAKPNIARYRKQTYEPVRSVFSLSWNSIVNLIQRHGTEHVRSIVDKSFLSWALGMEAEHQLAKAAELEAPPDGSEPTRGDLKEAQRLRGRAAQAGERTWQEFLKKRSFLQHIRYLAEDDTFNAGANVLQHIQIAEIFMTELVLSGEIEHLDPATLYGVLCAVSGELPRGVSPNFNPHRKDRELVARLTKVRMSPPVVLAEQLTNLAATWSPEMMILGREWADGSSLEEILGMIRSPVDIAGSLVSNFRRAKDLVGQLRAVYAEQPERARMLAELARSVARDEVEVVD